MKQMMAVGVLTLLAANVVAQPEGQIHVSGTGTVTVEPDMAIFTFGIQGQTDTAAVAMERADQVNGELVRELEALGIERVDIRSAPVTMNPFVDRPSQRQLINYSRTTTATLRDLDEIAAVYAAGLEAGVNSIGGVQFAVSNYEELADQARDLAIQDAREEAQAVAAALGVDVGRVISASVSRPPDYDIRQRQLAPAFAVESAEIRPGSIDVSVTANVSFEILHPGQ
jgi:uncharacterized protein YggE